MHHKFIISEIEEYHMKLIMTLLNVFSISFLDSNITLTNIYNASCDIGDIVIDVIL